MKGTGKQGGEVPSPRSHSPRRQAAIKVRRAKLLAAKMEKNAAAKQVSSVAGDGEGGVEPPALPTLATGEKGGPSKDAMAI